MLTLYTEIGLYETEEFDTVESALMTSCSLCGDPLVWGMWLEWVEEYGQNCIFGKAQCCGRTFLLTPSGNGERTGYSVAVQS